MNDTGFIPRRRIPGLPNASPMESIISADAEEAPFGSDEGHGTLFSCTKSRPEKFEALFFSAFPRRSIERDWGMEYVPVGTLDTDRIRQMASSKETDRIPSDRAAYAAAFAQIKITGSLSPDLRERGLDAIRRLALIEGELWTENEIRRKMVEDLRSFVR
ncbi:hypothetical protein [uncultured Alistipes sp.]|uniref:hypothetical protein n=1 Tax=uncultured Alistipes sp. TaxID=538949 RepID=UPI00260300DF|nr:hypothetical protein [uncultured Alistipes sp.]